MTAPLETGEDLVRALRAAAAESGLPLRNYLHPLTTEPNKYLRQLAVAKAPKAYTRSRIMALLQGGPIPRRTPALRETIHAPRASASLAEELLGRVVDRDPCPRCGVHGDIGCKHRTATKANLS